MKRLASADFVTGALFVTIGAAAILVATNYSLGTPRRMGPGMFPMIVGGLLVLIGSGVAIKPFVTRKAQPLDFGLPDVRPLAMILLAVMAFALLVDRAGLIVALLMLVLLAQLGDKSATLRSALALAVLIPLAIILLFVAGLGIPFQLWVR